MTQLRESSEVATITPHQINQLDLVKTKLAFAAMQQINSIVTSKEVSVDQVRQFRDKIAAGAKLSFVQQIMAELDEMLGTHEKMQGSVDRIKQVEPQIRQYVAGIRDAILSQQMATAVQTANKLQPIVDELDHGIDLGKQTKRTLTNNYTVQTAGFFTSSEWESVADFLTNASGLDFSKPLYSAVQFPDSQDINHVAYYLAKLSNSPSPVRMDTTGYRLYSKVANSSNKVFKELMALLRNYQVYNDKDSIQKITALINRVPELSKAMQRMRERTKVVYRGIDSGDLTDKQIIAHEKQERFVATTPSRSVAANFAHQRGHLESGESRSQTPRIITYRVPPEAILFDTRVLNIEYGETEIVIDATKATIEEISHEDN